MMFSNVGLCIILIFALSRNTRTCTTDLVENSYILL